MISLGERSPDKDRRVSWPSRCSETQNVAFGNFFNV